MNRVALFSLTALTLTAFADDEIAAAPKSDMNNPQPKAVNSGINTLTSAAYKSDHGWFVFADALYWHASVGNSDWAAKRTIVSSGLSDVTNHKLDFKWSWGFKAGIGLNSDYDGWDSVFYYTWFHTQNSNAIGVSETENSSAPHQALIEPGYSSGKENYNIHFSMFDWELGRSYFVGKKLSLRPHAGIKGGWIHQRVKDHFSYAQTSTTLNEKNNFWGVGVSGGVNSNWSLYKMGRHQFSGFGDLGAALMYGHFDNDYTLSEVASSGALSGYKYHDLDRNLAVPMLQAMFGLKWDFGYNQDRCHFAMKVGYEFQYWWNQNQRLDVTTTAGGTRYFRLSDDLALQGLTIDFRFDF